VNQTVEYIKKLKDLQEGERSRLRRLAGQPLHASLQGFDLFTGLWWPLRHAGPDAPRRDTSWLVAKLFCSVDVSDLRAEKKTSGFTLPALLGLCEPPRPACLHAAPLTSSPPDREPAKGQFIAARTFRRRYDALLCSPLEGVEPHLRWALDEVAKAVVGRVPYATGIKGNDWAQLLDDLSIWDRGEQHRLHRDVRDIWAEVYLKQADRMPAKQGV